jgi:hypothetical protein
MTCVLQHPNLESKSQDLEKKKDPKNRGMHCLITLEFDLMVKVGKLIHKFKNSFFEITSLKKLLNK